MEDYDNNDIDYNDPDVRSVNPFFMGRVAKKRETERQLSLLEEQNNLNYYNTENEASIF